ncbi:MAG: lytic transglycosylase domain-containing protein [Deltaproteobacteria bacterium]|nr:lytic transglycosylase domain-containing protein [Candidatus Anaeroferrophillacea bacterium]
MEQRNLGTSLLLVGALFAVVLSSSYLPAQKNARDTPAASAVTGELSATLVGERCLLADYQLTVDTIRSFQRQLSPRQARRLARYIWQAAHRFECDPALITALIQVESSFLSHARSHMGARGLMQLRPFVARALAEELSAGWKGEDSLHDPETNIIMGTCYLASLIRDFDDLPTALAAYNCGPTLVRSRLRRGLALPGRYAAQVISLYHTYRGDHRS